LCILLFLSVAGCSQPKKQYGPDDYLYRVVDTSETVVEFAYKDNRGDIVIPFGKYPMCFTDTIKTIGFVAIPKRGFWAINKNEELLFQAYAHDNDQDDVREGMVRIVD